MSLVANSSLAAQDEWTFLLGLTDFRHVLSTDETPSSLPGTNTREYTFVNLALGRNFGSFSLGARYLAGTINNENSLQNATTKTVEEDGINVWGLMAGYVDERVTLQLTLAPFGGKNHKLTTIGANGVNAVRSASYGVAMGEIFDIGYSFDARGIKFGPLLSFVTLKYGTKTQDGSTAKLHPQMGDDFFMPSLCLRVDF